MQGICVRLNCDREDPEDYAVVALGDDGNIYPLCPLFVEDIDTFKAAVELGFDETDLFFENECLREFAKVEEDPRRVIIYAENMDPRILGIICYNWIMEYPVVRQIVKHGVSEELPFHVTLQEDIKEAMAMSMDVFTRQDGHEKNRASLARLSSGLNTGSRKPILMKMSEIDRLFLAMQTVSSISVLAVDIIDGFRSAAQEMARYIAGNMSDLLVKIDGEKRRLTSASSYHLLRQAIISEQVDSALCVIEDMGAWSVEFEVE